MDRRKRTGDKEFSGKDAETCSPTSKDEATSKECNGYELATSEMEKSIGDLFPNSEDGLMHGLTQTIRRRPQSVMKGIPRCDLRARCPMFVALGEKAEQVAMEVRKVWQNDCTISAVHVHQSATRRGFG